MQKPMTPRERVTATLSHKEPDRVPYDLGGSIVTSMVKEVLDNFRHSLGLGGPPHELAFWQLGLSMPREDMLQLLEIDTRRLSPGPPDGFKDIIHPDGSCQDEWGVIRRPAGPYFDNVFQPLREADTVDDLKKYCWPDPDDPGRFAGLRAKAEKLYKETDYALVADIAMDGLLDSSREIVGLDKFMVDLYVNPGLAASWLDMLTEYSIRLLTNYMKAVGDYIQVVVVTDDLGFQDRMAISPEIYRKFLKPRHQKIYNAIKSQTKAKLMQHCCGSVFEIIPDLIEEGIDVLNPIQPQATNMSAAQMAHFKRDLSFWGGIDEQVILPRGSTEEVRAEVKRVIDILGPGGGFVPFASHNIQSDVPVDNIETMLAAIREFGVYQPIDS